MSTHHKMNWEQLMSHETQTPRAEELITANKYNISYFERDYEAILFS